ncbi:MAG: aspartate aminotransferase family protein [Rhodospirillales bacterium]
MTQQHTTAEYQAMDAAHHWHPFTDGAALAKQGARIIVRAEGSKLWDSEGVEILDGMAGLWCVNVGYGRPELAEAGAHQLGLLPYYNTFFQTSTPPAAELAKVLAELTPGDLNHAFFANSGSEANDTLVRLVRHYWALEGKPEKNVIIGRVYGYHGSTMASASLCGMSAMHAQGGLPLDGFEHVVPPYWYAFGASATPEQFGELAARAIEAKILEVGADRVAAFVGEPIQGAGGVIVPPETYWPVVQEICAKYDVLLAADEVICGFGRTGEWFGSDTFNIKADLMPIAKGLSSGYAPISALMVSDRIAERAYGRGGEFTHGFTYSGHPVSCAIALANIEVIKKERMVERCGEDIGPYFQKKLRTLADHPLVGEVRGVGLIAAVELVKNKDTRELFDPQGKVGGICRDHCLANNIIVRAVRDSMVLSPPLVITHEEADHLIDTLRRCIDLTAGDINRG